MHHRTIAGAIAIAVAAPVLTVGAASGVAAETITAATDSISTRMVVWLAEAEADGEPFDIHAVAGEHGVVVLDTLAAAQGIYLVGSTEVLDDGDIEKLFKKDDRVRYAEPDYAGVGADGNRFHAWPSGAPDVVDPAVGELLGLDLGAAHEHATGAGVTVAILDTGVDADHPVLLGHVVPGWDFVDDDDDPDDIAAGLDGDGDGYVDAAWGHGTHVSGIVAQIAPGAEILSYRVLDSDGSGRVYAITAAILDAVDRGADVINLSFGMDEKSDSKMLKDALKYAKQHDVVVVAAAGNDADEHKRYPAADKDVISVGAVDGSTDFLADFANHGDWVDVAAPGVAVVSALPDGLMGTWSGSSMAAPFVSAQASLLIEFAPDEKANRIKNVIRKSSRKLEKRDGWKLKYGEVDVLSSLAELR